MTPFARAYSWLMRTVFQKLLVPRFASAQRISEGRAQWASLFEAQAKFKPRAQERPRVWWHAASVGELEILWPVMIRIAENAANSPEFVITILSESAKDRLGKLVVALEKLGARPVFAGYSPWEGSWEQALRRVQPDLFVTSKYEAWPELWMVLSELEIPLSIVSAKDRRSLRICRWICRWLGGQLPAMTLMTSNQEDVAKLQARFPAACVEKVGEPRWDQVWNRAQAGNARAREIASSLSELPKPWGVLGSAWHEDVALWKNAIRKIPKNLGTVLIVPHRIDLEHLIEIEKVLTGAEIAFLKTADFASAESFRAAISARPGIRCVIVNEMGFLSELYSVADWAYIGGGIGRRGVHSTIEPAIHGIPISCGTYRAHQFVEIAELEATGQLTLIKTEEDLQAWLDGVSQSFNDRERWRLQAKERLGATERIVQRMVGILF